MIDPFGALNSWIVGRHFYKKSSKDLAEAMEDIKDFVHKELTKATEPLLKHASPEQRDAVMSTVENSTTAIVNAYMSTMKEPFSMTGSVETSVTPIDPATGKPEDKGPGYPGG